MASVGFHRQVSSRRRAKGRKRPRHASTDALGSIPTPDSETLLPTSAAGSAGDSALAALLLPAVHAGRRTANALSNILALDCEMVGVGERTERSMLAQVCIVNYDAQVVYCTYVAPTAEVSGATPPPRTPPHFTISNITPPMFADYRTWVSGVTAAHLVGAPPFTTVQREVAAILRGRVAVGHSVQNDFNGT